MSGTRHQCAKCPWKKGTDPHDIPGGYCETKHRALRGTISDGGLGNIRGPLRLMACHETTGGDERACVGWLAHQLGPGNNIGLRLAAARDRSLTDFALAGPQHERFEDTLPEDSP